MLSNRKGTTYNLNNRQDQLSEFNVNMAPDKPIVIDRNIITSYNPATAFDVAFKLLEILTSKENCDNVKIRMGFK